MRLSNYTTIAPRRQAYGGKGIRTPDIQLAKLALYQLSYAPGISEDPLLLTKFKEQTGAFRPGFEH